MTKIISLLSFILFIGIVAFAQESSKIVIKGLVVSSDGQPLPGATIRIKNTNRTTFTDDNGAFHFNNIEAGNLTLSVFFPGISPVDQTLNVVNGANPDVTIRFANTFKGLEEVIVNARRNRYKNDDLSSSLRLKTPILELPQNIQVISSEILADQMVFDVVDGITRNISGATRQGHWDNQYANIRMRGSKLPAFRNGMNIEASWGPTAEDAAMIDRIEFVKGPAGYMSSAGEPGGFYNVVTKKPTGVKRGSATFSVGSFSTYRAALDFDGKLSNDGKLLYRLNIAGQQKDYYTKYNYNKRVLIAPVLKYLVDDATSITLEYTYQGSSYLANGNYVFSPRGFADTGIKNDFFYGDPSMEPGKIRDHSAYVYLDHKINEKWSAHAQLAYFNFAMIANSTWASYMKANGDMPRYWSIGDEAGENRFGQFSFSGQEQTGKVRHRILFGGDFSNKKFWGDFRTLLDSIPFAFNVYDPKYGIPGSVFPDIDRSKSVRVRAGGSNYVSSVSIASAYVHDEMAFLDDKLRLSLGLRFTNSLTVGKSSTADMSDNVFSPRVGLSYSIDKSTSIYALFDKTFVPVSGTDWQGNAFKPIKGEDIEGGIKKEWGNGRWISSLTAYQIKRKNALVTDPDPSHIVNGQTFQAQLGETTTKGIEFDLSGEILPGLNANINYALTDSKISQSSVDSTIGTITPNTAKHVANAWLDYKILKGTLKGFGVMGSLQTQFDRAIGVTKTANFKNYVRTDAGVNYQKGKFGISLLVNNLFNNLKLMTAGSITTASAAIRAKGGVNYYSYIVEARRNFRISIAYRF